MSEKKIKVAVFSIIPTHPQDKGCRRRVYNLLEEFENQDCEIHIIYLPTLDREIELKSIASMRERWTSVSIFERKISQEVLRGNFSAVARRMLRNVDRNLGGAGKIIRKHSPGIYSSIRPISSVLQKITRQREVHKKKRRVEGCLRNPEDFLYDREVFDFVQKTAKKINPDIFICEFTWYSYVLDAVEKKVLKLIDTHDSFVKFAKYHKSFLNLGRSFNVTEIMEKRLLQRADIAIAIQDEEKKYFERLLGKGRAATIGHIIEIKKNLMKKKRDRLLFVGSDWPPNRHGFLWFEKNVLPIIRKQRPEITLSVVGGVSKHIKSSEILHTTRNAVMLAPYYELADVVICPIFRGAGLKIKAVEALGQGRPIVATTHVAEGLKQFNSSDELFIPADEAELFAAEILRLLENDEYYKLRQKNGLKFAAEYNSIQKQKISSIISSARSKNKTIPEDMSKKYEAAMFLQVCNKCNLTCAYCISECTVKNANKVPQKKINLEKFREFIQKLDKTFLFIYEGDGEPMLAPDILEMSKIITSQGHYIAITSNMTNNSVRKIAEEVNPKYIDYVFASAHTAELERRGLFEKYVSNCLAFQNRGVTVTCTEVGYPPLIPHADRLRKMFSERGLNLTFNYYVGKYEGKNYPYDYTAKELKILGLETPPKELFSVYGKYCNAGYNFFSAEFVSSDGDIFACRSMPRVEERKKLGNIWEGTLKSYDEPQLCMRKKCFNPYYRCNDYLYSKMLEQTGGKTKDMQIKRMYEDAVLNAKKEYSAAREKVLISMDKKLGWAGKRIKKQSPKTYNFLKNIERKIRKSGEQK